MHYSHLVTLAAVGTVLAGAVPASFAQVASNTPPRVAIFTERGFTVYGINALTSPQQMAVTLRAAGLEVDLLNSAALADPAQFNATKYAALVMPYGNTYPLEAFTNIRRFHEAKGSLITTGIPFTHAVAKVAARDWNANPRWGEAVQLALGQGPTAGTNTFRIQTENQDWTGVTSARFDVEPGDEVLATIQLKEVPMPHGSRLPKSDPKKKDMFYIRFFNAKGDYISQEGVLLSPKGGDWHTIRATSKAPTNTALADLSVQMQRGGHRFLVADFNAQVNGSRVALKNGDLSNRSNDFMDLGHKDSTALWGADGMGVGGFDGPVQKGPAPSVMISPGDPFHLTAIYGNKPAVSPGPAPQWVNPKSLPKGVRLIPAVGEAKRPLMALVVHENDAFKGAVDAWTYRPIAVDGDNYNIVQVISRATVAALSQRGVLDSTKTAAAFQNLDAQPKPKVWANVALPKVERRYETFQPKMPAPARTLYVADIRKMSADEKLLLTSLQGIVNRTQPRVYFLFDDDDAAWLDVMQKQGVTDKPVTVTDPWKLVDQFRSEFKGAVLCDPNVYFSPCLAVSIAGADDLIVAKTPELAAKANVPVTVDLRGKFKTNAEAIRYLRTEVLPKLDPYLTCSLDPAVFNAGAIDSLVAARASVFWITGPDSQNLPGANQEDEMMELRTMFSQMPLGAVVRGFWWHGDGVGLQESDGVAIAGRFGKVTLVSDLITNLSVHSGVPATELKQKPRPPAPKLDRTKTYVAFTMSDGDNLCTWRGYFRRYFDDPVRGSIPVGWGMSPAILDLAPDWARWYYENATPNDEFICDVSGVAYMYPSSWGTALNNRDEAFKWFYGRTDDYMKRMDMNTIRLMDVRAEDIARVGPLMPGLSYLMPDYGHAEVNAYKDLTYTLPTGQAIFRAATSGSGPERFAQQIRERAQKNRPAFINAFIWNWGSSLGDLKKTMEILGPDYIAVTPSQLNELYKQATQK